jgi:protein involved in polysaccharide export with SLBB domain
MRNFLLSAFAGALAAAALFAFDGCASPAATGGTASDQNLQLTLHAGDVIGISFPGSADNTGITSETIRRDGRISLPIIGGDTVAAGQTPSELEQSLSKLYGQQLRSSEVQVTVISSNLTVFVDGAVLKAGKIVVDRPLTVFQAIMEAGGFNYDTADLSAVQVIRKTSDDKGYQTFVVNVKDIYAGKGNDTFYLQPFDVVHVPKKFQFF